MLVERYPHLNRKKESDIKDIENAFKKLWEEIPEATFDALLESVPNRIEACTKAKGWQTGL